MKTKQEITVLDVFDVKFLDGEVLKVKERYKTLSELWNPKSKHATHLQISKMMDEALAKLSGLEEIIKKVKEILG